MEVRRSSDNALQDIGYDANGDLDTTALLSFVGAGDGFVRTWYDQSGNTNDAQQTTTSSQPQIITSGGIGVLNSNPSIGFVGSKNLTSFYDPVNMDSWLLVTSTTNTNNYMGGSTYPEGLRNRGANTLAINAGSDLQIATNTTSLGQILVATLGTSFCEVYLDGVNTGNGNIGASYTSSSLVIGAPLGRSFTGTYQEVVIYNTDQKSNINGLNTNINTYYSIY
jgi:hypothetical protein